MNSDELLASCMAHMDALDERLKDAILGMSAERLNAPIAPSNWSPAQIVQHLMLSNGPYIDALSEVVANAPAGSQDPIRHSWFGNFLIKVAGPKGNAPPPKSMVPGPGPYDSSILDAYLAQTKKMRALMDSSKGKDLNRARMSSPFFKLARMTLGDIFLVTTQHTERHVGQIEASLKG